MISSRLVKVFVSATTADLGEHRNAVRDELVFAKIDARVQGILGPDFRTLQEKLRAEIKSCDAVICLIGFVFGESPAGNSAQKSYTQLEYDFAQRAKIPIYVYMTPESAINDSKEGAKEKALQIAHREAVKKTNVKWEEIVSVDKLRLSIAHLSDEIHGLMHETDRPDNLEEVNGKFKIEDTIESREQEDIFKAYSMDVSSIPVRLHVLKPNLPTSSRVWFRQRYRCWKSIDHPDIVRILPESNPDSTNPRPYLALEDLTDWKSVANYMRHTKALESNEVLNVFRVVASVFDRANQKGIRLLTVSLNDVLLKDGDVKVGGFDTASPVRNGKICELKSWVHVSPLWKRMAPELHEDLDCLPETVDVFALGVLLERMQGREGIPCQELQGDARRDPLQCLVFHCLAADSQLRFQSLRQVRQLFADRIEGANELSSSVVDIVEHKLRFAKYLTTNSDYELFCIETSRELPVYHAKSGTLEKRLKGPWLPVTCINLKDAEAYCQWLSHRTEMDWRLPTITEWTMAATLQERCGSVHRGCSVYPWGNAPPDTTDDSLRFRSNFDLHFGGPTVVGAFLKDLNQPECYDLAGNVWEWIVDRNPPLQLVKGGSYDYNADALKINSWRAVGFVNSVIFDA